ncbi:ABC transporter substrate-binding protein [Brevibacterium spongiae]|uniref:ABC transporter substrate-binding protein n=1 Tax=Brevibacterium spongiae TaxID=2909672 RepID=A0ABY5SUA9_9MICO|nr:ABC transporter substrate-binding protein [Brevibacterium spongiae]UVI36289.1 ABC transporter substrate-binding protein [Brevibacterium spongiae]
MQLITEIRDHEGVRVKIRIGAALASAVLLAGCVPVQPLEDPPERTDVKSVQADAADFEDGGNLVMALSSEPDRLDPTTSSSLYTRYVMQTMCQKLYDIDENGEIVPMLATELPTISKGGKTVRIPVKQGVKFADGTDFDAEAVKTTIERGLNLEASSRAAELGPISSVEAADAHTVEVTFDQPFAPFTAALADRAGMVMSPTALEKQGDDFGDHPVCVGPFKFEKRIAQTSIKVVKDPNYYDADSIHLDSITYQIMTDANIRAANIRSGDVQVADTISPQDVDALDAESGIGLLQSNSLGYQGLTVNMGFGDAKENYSGPLGQNPEVRKALSMAIDRKALVNTVFNGWFSPACSGIAPDSPFATEASNGCVDYDPEGAKQILKDAGVELPLEVNMKVSNTQDTLRFAQAIQAATKEAGFDIKVQPTEYTALLDAQDRGDYEMLQLGWSGRVDPHGNLYSFHFPGAANNVTGIDDSEINGLLTKASEETEEKKRAELYGKASERMRETNSIIYLYRQKNLTAYTEDVAGIEVFSDGVVHLSGAGFLKSGGAK